MQSTKTNLIPITFSRKLLEDGIHQNENKNQEKEKMRSRNLETYHGRKMRVTLEG